MSFNVGSQGIKLVQVRDGIRFSNTINFVVTAPIVHPDPIIDSIDPTIVDANSSIVLSVLGQNFLSGAEILVNGIAQTTTFLNSEKLQTGIFNVGVVGTKDIQVRQNSNLSNIITLEVRPEYTITFELSFSYLLSQHWYHNFAASAAIDSGVTVNCRMFANGVEMPTTCTISGIGVQRWIIYVTPGRYFGAGVHALQLRDIVSGAVSDIKMVPSI